MKKHHDTCMTVSFLLLKIVLFQCNDMHERIQNVIKQISSIKAKTALHIDRIQTH